MDAVTMAMTSIEEHILVAVRHGVIDIPYILC